MTESTIRAGILQPIYLDYNATTPVAREVAEAMIPFLYEAYGNPSSSHFYGQRARTAVQESRASLARLIGAQPNEIIFTGCATEANNLAILGVARTVYKKRHLIISAVEHPAVVQPAKALQEQGWELTVLGVDRFGRVDAAALASCLRPDTALVSIMYANNEVGTIQPIAEIGKITRAKGVLLHVDAAQCIGKIPVKVDDLGADLLTLAGHKFYAPKGVGVLYVREGTVLRSIAYGADQEHGLRPGTENVLGIVGIGAAAQLAERELSAGIEARLRTHRDSLHRTLKSAIPDLVLNGHPDFRLPNTLNVSFPGVSARELLATASQIVAASVGAACHSEGEAVSGVLAAMGVSLDTARSAVRLSVGTPTSEHEIMTAATELIERYTQLNSYHK